MAEPGSTTIGRPGLAALSITALVYLPLLWADYVWDDDALILANTALEGIDGLIAAWTGGLWDHTPSANHPPLYYRPWMLWSLWLDRLLGQSAMVAHAHSLVWHLVCVLLTGLVGQRLGAGRTAAWGGALLFGLHPVAVESVAWVSARNDTMALAGTLGAVWLALDTQRSRSHTLAGVVACALFAAGSKESAYLLPVALVPVLWAARVPWKAPTAAALTGVGAVVLAHGVAGVGWPEGASPARLFAAAPSWAGWTLDALFWPGHRAPGDHLRWATTFSIPGVLLAATTLGSVVRWGPRPAVGMLAFGVCGAATAWPAVAHVGSLGDRYVLATLAGTSIAVALTAGALSKKFPARAVLAGSVIPLLALAGLTSASIPAWRDDPTLWEAAHARHDSPLTAASLAKVVELEGDLDRAATLYRAGLVHNPPPHICWNIAAIELKRGQPQVAAVAGQVAMRTYNCPPDPELVCPMRYGQAWTGSWTPTAHNANTDPTGLCTIVDLALEARAGRMEALDSVTEGSPDQKQALAARLVPLLEAGRDPTTAEAVKAWASGTTTAPGG